MFDVPILLVIFNRPETTRKVFDAIKDIKPVELFIAADGPRSQIFEDRRLVKETRAIVRKITWKCRVHYLLRKQNMGCGINMARAISWFFKHVPEGIIFEDDCLPDPSFFRFARELLNRYRSNRHIMSISGDNFQGSHRRGRESYYFSIFPSTWGWATWRRAWKLYKFSRWSWNRNLIEDYFTQPSDITYWTGIFDEYLHGQRDVWDYQWIYTCWENRALNIIPQYNLVTNIGMNSFATHTKNNYHLQIRSSSITFPLIHPSKIESYRDADDYTERKVYSRKNSWSKKLSLYVRQCLDSLQF